MGRAIGGDPVAQLRLDVFGNDADPRARLAEQPRLGQRFVAAADDGHGFALDPKEDGKGVQLGVGIGHGARAPEDPPFLAAAAAPQKKCTRAA